MKNCVKLGIHRVTKFATLRVSQHFAIFWRHTYHIFQNDIGFQNHCFSFPRIVDLKSFYFKIGRHLSRCFTTIRSRSVNNVLERLREAISNINSAILIDSLVDADVYKVIIFRIQCCRSISTTIIRNRTVVRTKLRVFVYGDLSRKLHKCHIPTFRATLL